jgi:hypothetical protein
MKRCPNCGTTYTDETLRFCLADGASLVFIGNETFDRAGARLTNDAPATEIIGSYPTVASRRPGSPVVKIVIALLVAGLLALIGIGAAGAFFYMNSGGEIVASSPTPTPKTSPTLSPRSSPTSDDGSEELEKELADLQKKLEEIVKTAPGKSTSEPDDDDGTPTATVNSPKDGFLALRDKPDAKKGVRLAQIPHGAKVYLENCEKERVTIDGRAGRWCMVTYNDQTGWVFDAWLTY